eukprot:scpid99437/ scgid13634/ 
MLEHGTATMYTFARQAVEASGKYVKLARQNAGRTQIREGGYHNTFKRECPPCHRQVQQPLLHLIGTLRYSPSMPPMTNAAELITMRGGKTGFRCCHWARDTVFACLLVNPV